ncbi:MAG: glycosyltransferase [Oligosphaeraceae bacterium]|nr:glycosyltransferase [Oligosphaeraceae bacterium]
MSITLITICLNSAATLQRCLDSVLLQTCKPDEYLFVDGGSSDTTLAILEEQLPRLQAAGMRARVIQQQQEPEAAGIPAAWNLGLKNASGEIIALLNSDDWYEPQTLQTVSQAFAAGDLLDGVVCPVNLLAAGQIVKILPARSLRWLPVLMPVPHPGCFFHRRLYERLGHYDTRYSISADYDFIWRCRQKHARLQYLPRALVNMEAGGLANRNRKLARNETYIIAKRHTPWLALPRIAWLLRATFER